MKTALNNYAFIDSQNLNLAIRDLGWCLDWKKFYHYIIDKYSVKKVYLFIGYFPGNEPLYNSMMQIGYTLVFKPTLRLPDGSVKGNVDAELVLHAMIQYNNYDAAVIVTGDGDFYCLVEYLSNNGKLKKLIIPNRNKFSSLLRKFAENINYLNELNNKLGYSKDAKIIKEHSLRTKP